jgi:hypothetical protein
MPRNFLLAVLVLSAVPGIAFAGEFPGLVETIVSAMAVVALVLGFLTEGVLAALRHRKLRWQRGLAYAVLWLVGIFIVLWTRRV